MVLVTFVYIREWGKNRSLLPIFYNLYFKPHFTGDLKLVEKPQPVTMGAHDFTNIKANVKVASTENGIIFGNIGGF